MRRKKQFSLMISAFAMIVFFQNCGREDMAFMDSIVNENLDYFGYEYTSKPEFYYDVKVIPQPQDGDYKIFSIVGGVAPADADVNIAISYEIHILDANGHDICPVVEGDNQGGETLIEDSCATQATNKAHKLESHVFYGNEEHVFTQNLGGI